MKYLILLLILIGFLGSAFALEPNNVDYFSNPAFNTYQFQKNGFEFFVPYSTDAKIHNILIDCNPSTMIINLKSTSNNGTLTINLPRSLLDTRSPTQDGYFFVLVDGKEVDYLEIEKNPYARTLIIPLKASTQVEIITTIDGKGPEKRYYAVDGTNESQYYRPLSTKEQLQMYHSPLKQFKSGISLDKIQCKDGLVVIQRHDGTPMCVSYSTGEKILQRGSGVCPDMVVGRGHPCGFHSAPDGNSGT